MSEIQEVVAAPFKGKKGIYMVAAVGAVAVFALYMRSRSASSGATVAVGPDNTGSNLAGLGQSIQQSNEQLQAHLDESNAALASGMSALGEAAGQQSSEIATLQAQIASALSNQESIVGSIGSLTSAATAQAKQAAEPPKIVKSIFGNSVDLTSALSKFGGQSGFTFVNTEGMSDAAINAQLKAAGANALIVGGNKAGGGVSETAAAGTGVVRVAGQDRDETAKLLSGINF